METNVNLRMLINERMIPIMRSGHIFQVKDVFSRMHSIWLDWKNYVFFIDGKTMSPQDFYYELSLLLQHADPKSSLMIDGEYFLPVNQIDCFIPRLQSSGKRFKTWKRCE